jgi:hypothetical protein
MRFLYLQIIASGLLLWRLFGSPCPSYAANKPVGSDSAKLAAVDPTPSAAQRAGDGRWATGGAGSRGSIDDVTSRPDGCAIYS